MYDIIVIGAGPAGYEVASLLASGGKKVCIVEKEEQSVGGTCLNEGCVPAKNFLEKSSNIKELKLNTDGLISDLRSGILTKLKKSKVDIKYGHASFVDENSIKIDGITTETIRADKIIIASGSSHKDHPLMPLQGDKIISSREVFKLTFIPKSILIVGGGAIGCEFATFFNAHKCEVDIAEFTPRIVPNEDDDVSRTLKRELEKRGIKVYLNANIVSYDVLDDCVSVDIDLGKKNDIKKYDMILISIGRVPNTNSLTLSNANIKTKNGFIEVDENLQSLTNKHIYAIGDVIQTPALAHIAYYEAKRVAQIIQEQKVMSKEAIFPSVTFCTPQVASIGQNERELKEKDTAYKVKKIFFKSNAKAKIKGDDSGFIKVIYSTQTDKILGASIIGNDATELIHQFLILINLNATLHDISKMIFAHPTLSEAMLDLTHI